MTRETRTAIALALVVMALGLRLTGIYWGIRSDMGQQEPTFHPDEIVMITHARTLYTAPSPIALGWGGALYFRLSLWVQKIVTDPGKSAYQNTRRSILYLRLLNIPLMFGLAWFLYCLVIRLSRSQVMAFLAVAFALSAPTAVLESHYARPDVLLAFFCTASLYYASHLIDGFSRRAVFLSSFFAGLAMATMMWGLFLPPLVGVAWIEGQVRCRRTSGRLSGSAMLRQLGSMALIGTTGIIAGYLAGSIESFIFFREFKMAMARSFGMHEAQLSFPLGKMVMTASYAFGLPSVALAYVGLLWAMWRKERGIFLLVAYFVLSWFVEAKQAGDMTRYLLFLLPVMAVACSYPLVFASQSPDKVLRAAAYVLGGLALVYNVQVSLGYSLQMAERRDIRYRAADLIVDRARGRSYDGKVTVGVTQSYHGDWTYQPRFRDDPLVQVKPLMLRYDADVPGYLKDPPEYVAVSDLVKHIGRRGKAESDFLNAIEHGGQYRLLAKVAPTHYAILLEDLLHFGPRSDILYLRLKFYIYERLRMESLQYSMAKSSDTG
jgi:hypothetical protein